MGRGEVTLAAALHWIDPPLAQPAVINQKVVDCRPGVKSQMAAANRGGLASAPRPLARPTKAFWFGPKCRDLGR